MYTALYRTYRPETFNEVLGQEHIVRILKNQIANDSTSHAYLFCGTRGTGKTTTARLLAKGLNCQSDGEKPCGTCYACQAIKDGTYMDVIEIDAASNNGVDNIRELRESVDYPPVMGRKKVYIIDEVHMLSSGAFNALLKTLEEPPEYVVFILATTEVQKLPATILSRCMRLDFKRVPEQVIMDGMVDICKKIGIDVSEDALRIIAANADGSVRDGLSILDQCISGGEKRIEADDVLDFLGSSGTDVFIEMTDLIRKRKTTEAIELLAHILADGKDVRQFMRDWIDHYRNLLMIKFVRNPQEVISLSEENIDRIRRQSSAMDLADLNKGILQLSRTMSEAKWSTQPRILLELCIIKLCMGEGEIVEAIKEPELKSRPQIRDDGPGAEAPAARPAAQPESKPAPQIREPEPITVDERNFELEDIWDKVFDDPEASKGTHFLVRANAMLTELGEETFTVTITGTLQPELLDRHRALIERLMEKYTGKKRFMEVATRVVEQNRNNNIEEIAADVSSLLGVDVTVE